MTIYAPRTAGGKVRRNLEWNAYFAKSFFSYITYHIIHSHTYLFPVRVYCTEIITEQVGQGTLKNKHALICRSLFTISKKFPSKFTDSTE